MADKYELEEMQKKANKATDDFVYWSNEITRLYDVILWAQNSSGGCKWKPANLSGDSVGGLPPDNTWIYKKSSDDSSENCHKYANACFEAKDATVIAQAKAMQAKEDAATYSASVEELRKTLAAAADAQVKTEESQKEDASQLQKNVITIVIIVVTGVAVFIAFKLLWR